MAPACQSDAPGCSWNGRRLFSFLHQRSRAFHNRVKLFSTIHLPCGARWSKLKLLPIVWRTGHRGPEGSPQMASASPAHRSQDSTPLLVWSIFTMNTHPSIILQQWMRAKPAEDSVTVHNGLMAKAVGEFTATHARAWSGCT